MPLPNPYASASANWPALYGASPAALGTVTSPLHQPNALMAAATPQAPAGGINMNMLQQLMNAGMPGNAAAWNYADDPNQSSAPAGIRPEEMSTENLRTLIANAMSSSNRSFGESANPMNWDFGDAGLGALSLGLPIGGGSGLIGLRNMIESGQLRHGVPELMGRPNFWPGGQMIDPAQMELYGQENDQYFTEQDYLDL